ncbi:hypothetical protein D3C72_185720 [compost metagenome]
MCHKEANFALVALVETEDLSGLLGCEQVHTGPRDVSIMKSQKQHIKSQVVSRWISAISSRVADADNAMRNLRIDASDGTAIFDLKLHYTASKTAPVISSGLTLMTRFK